MLYFTKRSLAYLIDCTIAFSLVMLLIQWAVLSQFRHLIGITDEWFQNSINMECYVLLTISLPVWLYFTILDSKISSGSIGKRLMKLQLRNSQDGYKIGFGKSFVRTILKLLPWELAHLGIIFPSPLYFTDNPEVRMLSYVGIILLILYILSIFFSKKSQVIYDQWLGVNVISKK